MVIVLSIIIGLCLISYFMQWRKKKRSEDNSVSIPKSYISPEKKKPSLSTDEAIELMGVEFDVEESKKTVDPVSFSDDQNPTFELKVEDVFHISGRGTVVTGTVSKGSIKINDKLFLVKSSGIKKPVTVKGIEQFRKLVAEAREGEAVGVLLDGINKADVERNDFLLSEH